MSNQHRATPEHWAEQERWAAPPDSDPYAMCLLELRARVEALESAASGLHGKTAGSTAALSLVDQVAIIIATWASDARPGTDATPTARAAIRAVAEWLRERDSEWAGGQIPGADFDAPCTVMTDELEREARL